MDSVITSIIVILLIINLAVVILLLKRKKPDQLGNEQVFKDEVNSLKNSFSQSFRLFHSLVPRQYQASLHQ